jgi:deoxyribodipyrimidine photolyase-related protein
MILIILPNQLFPIKMLDKIFDKVILIEEPRYFTDFRFHKLKLVYHRASMKKYENEFKKYKINTSYIDFDNVTLSTYKTLNKDTTYYFNPIDHQLNKKLEKVLSNANKIDNLNFLLTPTEIETNKNIFYKNNKYSHDLFYKFQRTRLDILIKNDKPVGNKWSFDTENRLPLPKEIKIPKIPKIKKDKYYNEAKTYIEKHFKKNYGSVDEWIYPIDNKSAIQWLKVFLTKRLNNFGPYEDAVSNNTDSNNTKSNTDSNNTKSNDNIEHNFLFHSVLSPMMNIGILPDKQVIEISNKYYENNKSDISLQSYEGFIRQIIGWRNYVYAVYLLEPDMYEQNYLKHNNTISDKYWLGDTNIKPIDSIVNKIVKYSYAHHIERLMYLGNWFLINQVNPKEVHRIFMEWTIDAYDWVMVPNVMGMSQYADGGKMMTRIYFSSSNYIDKMSNYKRSVNDNWWKIWDAIYYSFINKHSTMLAKNYATARQVKHWTNKTKKEQEELLELAKHNKIN